MKITLGQPYSFYQLGQRGNQEDARYPDSDAPGGDPKAFVVCDGVGGMDKGEVASSCVAETLGSYMQKVDLNKPFTDSDFAKALTYTYTTLEAAIAKGGAEMGTTLTFVCFAANGALCAHIGDSRIYHIRPGAGIMYRSEDHSLVNALVHSGNLTPEQAKNHPQSNIITRCMGYVPKGHQPSAAATLIIDDVDAGDYFFMCTDGVSHCFDDDDELYSIIADMGLSDSEKIRQLADKCRFSSDNNTAYLIPVTEVTGKPVENSKENPGGNTTALKNPANSVHDVNIITSRTGFSGLMDRISDWLAN